MPARRPFAGRRALRVAGVALAFLLAACAPDWNWRDVHPEGGELRVMLPARPVHMTRQVVLDGARVPMTMHGAKVGETAFTVAWADLPEERADLRERVVAAMIAGMIGNVGGATARVERRQAQLAVVDATGKVSGALPMERVDARGRAGEREVALHAGFAARGKRAWQFVVVGDPVADEQVAVFFDSLRVIAP